MQPPSHFSAIQLLCERRFLQGLQSNKKQQIRSLNTSMASYSAGIALTIFLCNINPSLGIPTPIIGCISQQKQEFSLILVSANKECSSKNGRVVGWCKEHVCATE